MSNVVQLRRWYYPTTVRVIMDGKAYYHATVIECENERASFQEFELRAVFGITGIESWLNTALYTWADARRKLDEKIASRPDVPMQHEFFATLRPRHKEMMFADETRRREVLRLAGRA